MQFSLNDSFMICKMTHFIFYINNILFLNNTFYLVLFHLLLFLLL